MSTPRAYDYDATITTLVGIANAPDVSPELRTVIRVAFDKDLKRANAQGDGQRVHALREALTYTTPKEESPYGYCPHCGANVVSRERRPNGNDRCANEHTFPSSATVPRADAPPEPPAPQEPAFPSIAQSGMLTSHR